MNLKKKIEDRRFGEIFPGAFQPHTVILGALLSQNIAEGAKAWGWSLGLEQPLERGQDHTQTLLLGYTMGAAAVALPTHGSPASNIMILKTVNSTTD